MLEDSEQREKEKEGQGLAGGPAGPPPRMSVDPSFKRVLALGSHSPDVFPSSRLLVVFFSCFTHFASS